MSGVNTGNAVEAATEARNRAGGECGPSSVRRSLSMAKLAGALSKAQGKLKNPPKDSVNPHFKSKYADLATVRDTVFPVLTEHGLSVVQMPCELEAGAALTTILMHDSGEYIETTMLLRASKSDPQGIGSALTYARRYALMSLAGVAADEDDDGNAASRPHQQQAAAKPAPAPQRQPEPAKPVAQPSLPANGAELHRRIQDYDAKLAGQKACPRGALLAHVTQAGVKAGYAADMNTWTGPAIPFAVDAVKEFEQRCSAKA